MCSSVAAQIDALQNGMTIPVFLGYAGSGSQTVLNGQLVTLMQQVKQAVRLSAAHSSSPGSLVVQNADLLIVCGFLPDSIAATLALATVDYQAKATFMTGKQHPD